MFRNLLIVLSCSWLGASNFGVALPSNPAPSRKPVCYFVASDKVTANERSVHILMDKADFSVGMLRPLMEYVFSEYSEPSSLEVYLDTDRSHWALADYEPRDYSYPIAYFYRKGGNQLIRYRLSGPKLRTIVVKGDDPLSKYDSVSKQGADPVSQEIDAGPDPYAQGDSKPFCYFIDLNRLNVREREIRVLMDEQEFTEKNLKILLRRLIDQNPEPDSLSVLVAPTIEVLDDLIGAPTRGDRPTASHAYATFQKKGSEAIIRFNLPWRDIKTITLRN